MTDISRAQRRKIARTKAPCPLCRQRLGHRNMVELQGFAVHAACATKYTDAQTRARAEAMGLTIADAGALLATP